MPYRPIVVGVDMYVVPRAPSARGNSCLMMYFFSTAYELAEQRFDGMPVPLPLISDAFTSAVSVHARASKLSDQPTYTRGGSQRHALVCRA